ncbi:uncharacterized protein LOC114559068 isoform X1 [Perca flavescens]|uniref:uncharacterized protein LOC114559068 isoform X1 n=1 Tax=Perca flavescens TaxID=8167 RepID=UPI00106EB1E9|nr:uncharacterized protein LOC114559068 isoform X1 [Perca flavescens]
MSLESKILCLTEGKPTKRKTVKLIRWLQNKKLLKKKIRCKLCQNAMKLKKKHNSTDVYRWVCRHKSHRGRKITKTIRTGSVFENSKCSLISWMKFFYRFSQGLRLRQVDMKTDGIAKSSTTLSKMAACARRVCRHAMKRHETKTGKRLGDEREFVVIDESNFRHKRKYGRGRISNSWRRKNWVFGMLGVKGKHRRPLLKLVKRRSRNHLLPLVVKHVRPGTVIISDEWRAYRGALTNLGYTHFTVNHSRWFVDPVTGAHTQQLERAWLTYKSIIWRLRGNRTEKLLKEHLAVIEWTYWLGNRHRKGPLGRLLKDIRVTFP